MQTNFSPSCILQKLKTLGISLLKQTEVCLLRTPLGLTSLLTWLFHWNWPGHLAPCQPPLGIDTLISGWRNTWCVSPVAFGLTEALFYRCLTTRHACTNPCVFSIHRCSLLHSSICTECKGVYANVHIEGYIKAFLANWMFSVHAAAVLCTGWECLKGLRESPWEARGMRGRPNCGWQCWRHLEDEVQADLCCILKDH